MYGEHCTRGRSMTEDVETALARRARVPTCLPWFVFATLLVTAMSPIAVGHLEPWKEPEFQITSETS